MGSYRFSRDTIHRTPPDNTTVMFASDIHFPNESPGWDLSLKVAKAIKPEMFYLGGDVLDLVSVSNHSRKLEDRTQFDREIRYAHRELARLRKAVPNADIVFRMGNHDARYDAFLEKNSPELVGVTEFSLRSLLKLDDLGIEFVEHGTKEFFGHIAFMHGDEVDGSSAKAKFGRMQHSFICGHHHRFDAHFSKDFRGEMRAGFFNGCLYDPSHADYVAHESWQLGFSLIHFVKGFFEVRQIPIHRIGNTYFCSVNGRYFEVEGGA